MKKAFPAIAALMAAGLVASCASGPSASEAGAFAASGEAYFEMGEYDLAIADLSFAIRLDPSLSRAFFWRGRAHARRMDFDLAVSDFSQALLCPRKSPRTETRTPAFSQAT